MLSTVIHNRSKLAQLMHSVQATHVYAMAIMWPVPIATILLYYTYYCGFITYSGLQTFLDLKFYEACMKKNVIQALWG